MKTYGYLIALEHDEEILANVVESAIAEYFDSDAHYKQYGKTKIDVEFLGEIECYEGQEKEESN